MQLALSTAKIKFPAFQEVRIERMYRHVHSVEPVDEPWLLSDKMRALFTPTSVNGLAVRYRVCYGGRGGGRSWGFGRGLLLRALRKQTRIFCAREFQNSINDSIHQLLCDQIEMLRLQRFFVIKKTTIETYNGGFFIFGGLKSNVTKLKSMEGIDICYIEEAEKISANSWKILDPTIRKNGSEIWAAFNPDLEKDATYQKFIVNPPPDALVVKATWADNPWFPKVLNTTREYMRRVDLDAYNHVWEGGPRKNSEAQIFRNKYVVESFTPHVYENGVRAGVKPGWCGPYFGVDWGFSQDPTVMVKCWIFEQKLYIEYEAWGVGVDTNDIPQKLFDAIPDSRLHISRADCSRPETISALRNLGYSEMVAVEKWPGSVEDGISHLRSYEMIVIHPRCEHMQEEALYYSYKVDKLSEDVLTEIVDKFNHCWDAVRYALAPMIKKGGAEMYLEYLRNENATAAAAREVAKAAEPNNNVIEYYKLMGAK